MKNNTFFSRLVASAGAYRSVLNSDIYLSKEGYPSGSSYTFSHGAEYGDLYLTIELAVRTFDDMYGGKVRVILHDKNGNDDYREKEYALETLLRANYGEGVVTRMLEDMGHTGVLGKAPKEAMREDVYGLMGVVADVASTMRGYSGVRFNNYKKPNGEGTFMLESGYSDGSKNSYARFNVLLQSLGNMEFRKSQTLIGEGNKDNALNRASSGYEVASMDELIRFADDMQPRLTNIKD